MATRAARSTRKALVIAAAGAGAVLALVLTVLVAEPASDGAAAPKPKPSRSESAKPMAWDTADRVKPVAVDVPSIRAQSDLIGLGLNSDGSLETPSVDKPMQAGWYKLGPTPGEDGAAVITGHVDGRNKPGIFYKLGDVEAGDKVLVKRADRSVVRFVVDKVREVPKTNFPTKSVYGDRDEPELRLVTCSGDFDRSAGSYVNNTIVYASAETLVEPSGKRHAE